MEDDRSKFKIIWDKFIKALPLVVILMTLTALPVLAGTLDAPSAPANTTSHTLANIYERLTTGNYHEESTFTEPQSAPNSGTMHSLDEIYSVAKPGAITNIIPKTGDTYDDPCENCTGEDGETQYGIAWVLEPTPFSQTGAFTITSWTGVRFTDNGDGTITDNLTGLMWMKDLGCTYTEYETAWEYALMFAEDWIGAGLCGLSDDISYTDWRLPNVHELHSLMDISQSGPALAVGHPFVNVPAEYSSVIWTSTTHLEYTNAAYVIRLFNGHVSWEFKESSIYVLFVRGGS